MALILRNGGSQSPDRWLKEPRNNHRTNLENYLNIAQVYYALPKGTLKEDIPLSISIKELAKLSNVSSLEKTYHILHEDDRELSCILKNCLTAPTAPKDASESE